MVGDFEIVLSNSSSFPVLIIQIIRKLCTTFLVAYLSVPSNAIILSSVISLNDTGGALGE